MLNKLSNEVYNLNKDKGFWEVEDGAPVNVPEKLMLIVSELSEALEALRTEGGTPDIDDESKALVDSNTGDEDFKDQFRRYVKDSFQDEIADTFIRLFDLSGFLDIDLEWHISNKLKYNALRPYKHGKKF